MYGLQRTNPAHGSVRMVQILSRGPILNPSGAQAPVRIILLCRKDLKDPPTTVGGIQMTKKNHPLPRGGTDLMTVIPYE